MNLLLGLAFLLVFQDGTLVFVSAADPVTPAPRALKPEAYNVKGFYQYRRIQWCLTGQGEQPLYQWPYTQYKSFLLKSHVKPQRYKDNKFSAGDFPHLPDPKVDLPDDSFKLTFNKISCNATKAWIGKDGFYLQRAHVKFIGKKEVPFQGVLIQAVHSPFGMGLPFGQFDVTNEFACSDCKFNFTKVIGCVSRPDVSLMHSTVAAYHYLQKKDSDINQDIGMQPELHWNFKWMDSDCHSAKTVEFWALIVFDFDNAIWMVKKFGPFDFTRTEQKSTAPDDRDVIRQPALPSPIFPACYPPPPTSTMILNDNAPPVACFREFGVGYNASRCYQWMEKKRQDYKTANPNSLSTIICETEKPYDYFKAEGGTSGVQAIPKPDWSPIRIEGLFDRECLQTPNRNVKKSRQSHRICREWQGLFHCASSADEDSLNKFHVRSVASPDTDESPRFFPKSTCLPCLPDPPTPQEKVQNEDEIIKRGFHGGAMIFAFFFFLPVSITVCRFYKETLITREVGGWRTWLVTHVGLVILVVLLSYISYTFPTFYEMTGHILVGYAALFCCAGGIITGWFRHKTPSVLTVSFYLHMLSGYAGWGLAIGSMVIAPGIGPKARLLCYFASAFSLAAMAVLTCHICSVDNKIEMVPKRSHFPIVEIRFTDLFPPGHKFRKFFLIIYAAVQFLVVCGMLTL